VGRVLVYFVRFALIFAAYVCAALAASLFIHMVALGFTGTAADVDAVRDSMAFSVPAVALFVSYFAFLPSIPAILLSEAFGWRDWLYYAAAGAVVATIGIFLLTASEQHASGDVASARFWATIVGSGMVGGIAYWLVAGRLAGNWRARVAASPERSGP
jgi:hypothetical protein